ncbi:2-oxoacid:ferredoxin oxidoreductase subunit beta [Legionella impletisoli]|uniref:2-oxoglutarate ferredoxin oxidoreductase subunit beta n=1 Tax=Legionella impletisoli TaxID=343510 RepID=A0A917JYM8_9GAMM|nr:2-oxoacid:ferredoxin oxidoreductase subunit beta [Legionella impletisoli]GGI91718.1 2-oxoglutarate ferredoxin oxidoreductase subunit beta [Legionella impletisoli]
MNNVPLTRKDFTNDNDVRWCPGCGDYAILAALQKVLPEMGLPPEKHVFVSGIGCAGRLPYYMNTYGLHTIHGRATAVATGLKAMHDDLCVWVITGDGDALSIGGNHLIHCLRRNVDLNILLINNQVYGLTKGQFSPTSRSGQITKTSPQGVNSQPMNPIALALSAGATFVARAVDKDPKQLGEILKLAADHKGISFVEIYQDCHIFNHGAFDAFTQKAHRSEHTIELKSGEPLYFGSEQEWILEFNQGQWQKRDHKNANGYCHNSADFIAAMRLAQLSFPDFPVPLGVYYQADREVFSFKSKMNKKVQDLQALYRTKASWRQD